ncbi:virulence-associated E family protein [Oenococcus oeni]|uniref:virulence-associated E family protein n=1 Tax=Oenococcus oeni TaxID=1247 RepID=UPI0008F7E6A6|nr:virulence-associated E family protein [Oenococcus oeni]OIL89945.1 helicase [Oenococcus oeni]
MTLEQLNEQFKEFLATKKDVTPSPIPGLVMYKDGRIKASSLVNIEKLLEHDFKDSIKFNDFTQGIQNTALIRLDTYTFYIQKLDDDFLNQLRSYLDSHYGVLFASDLIFTAISNVAHRNKFNPVVDYFNLAHKVWDGKDRFSTLFPDFLGVDKTPVTTMITKIWLTGAVAKVFEQKFKFDYVLDLVGSQGAGKTSLLEKLSFGYYTQSVQDFTNKDYFSMMLKALIVNDDEMKATRKAGFDELKSFITATELEFRQAYARTVGTYSKHFVIARTTNEMTYLKDKTGERRFMPLLAHKEKAKYHAWEDTQEQTDYIQQVWGQAMDVYREYLEGEFSFQLTKEQEDMLAEQRESFMYVDETENQINQFLDNFEGDFVTSANMAFAIAGESNLVNNHRLASQIKNIMDNKKGWKYTQRRISGIRKHGYSKE